MMLSSRLVLAALAVTVFGPSAFAGDAKPSAMQVLVAAKRASGGAAWDQLSGVQLQGSGGGAEFKMWFDLHDYGQRVEIRKDGNTVVQGFNGKVNWTTAAGKTSLDSAPESLAMARNGAYFGSFAYFFPARFKASVRYLRLEREPAASFDVVEVTPESGKPVDLWFDRKTRLLDRFVDRMGPQVVTIAQSDYRWAAGVLIPHRSTVADTSGEVLEEGRSDLVVGYRVDRTQFDPPSP